ncbi:MAG: hypothetical protein GY861_03750 [bacterium]|nr:hypothetical protein [bacterium]
MSDHCRCGNLATVTCNGALYCHDCYTRLGFDKLDISKKGGMDQCKAAAKEEAERASAELERLSRCENCKHEYKAKAHPLDEQTNYLVDLVVNNSTVSGDYFEKKLRALLYESIKYGVKSMMEKHLYDDKCFHADLKRDGHEDWIV